MSERPGSFKGRHFTDWVDTVKTLKRQGDVDSAIDLLTHLVDATEAEARVKGWGVAPWYYEQLAMLLRKRGDAAAELTVLERYEAQPHAPGGGPLKLAQRLARMRAGVR